MATARTRFDWRAEIVRPTPTAIHERPFTLADTVRSGRLSRDQSGNGMALRGSVGHAGEKSARGAGGDTANRFRACAVDWSGRRFIVAGRSQLARQGFTLWRGSDPFRFWHLPARPLQTPEMGGHARGLPGSDPVVFPDGLSPWRRVDAGADLARLVSSKS